MVRFKAALYDPRLVATAVVVLGGLAIYAVNFPGSMEYDSFVQWLEGRRGVYGYWHPPVMSWILGVFDALPGSVAGWFTGMDMLFAFAALAALLWLPKQVSWAAAGVAAVFGPGTVISAAAKEVLAAIRATRAKLAA